MTDSEQYGWTTLMQSVLIVASRDLQYWQVVLDMTFLEKHKTKKKKQVKT